MFYPANGKSPQLSPTARIAQGARLVGQVQLMENSSVWYNAVLRADNAPMLPPILPSAACPTGRYGSCALYLP